MREGWREYLGVMYRKIGEEKFEIIYDGVKAIVVGNLRRAIRELPNDVWEFLQTPYHVGDDYIIEVK